MTFAGIAVLVLAIVVGVGGGYFLAAGAVDHKSREEIATQVRDTAIVSVMPGETRSVELTSGMSYTLWPEPGTAQGSPPVVTDAAGDELAVNVYGSVDWASGLSAWWFLPRQTGTYDITASDVPVVLAPHVAPAPPDVGVYSSLVGMLGVLSAVVLAVVGLALAISGGIWWARRAGGTP